MFENCWAGSLRAVVAQRLLPHARGTGRVVAVEVLRRNAAVANLIREGKTPQLISVLQSSRKEGMVPSFLPGAQLCSIASGRNDIAAGRPVIGRGTS